MLFHPLPLPFHKMWHSCYVNCSCLSEFLQLSVYLQVLLLFSRPSRNLFRMCPSLSTKLTYSLLLTLLIVSASHSNFTHQPDPSDGWMITSGSLPGCSLWSPHPTARFTAPASPSLGGKFRLLELHGRGDLTTWPLAPRLTSLVSQVSSSPLPSLPN